MILLIGPVSVGKTLLLKRLQNSNPTSVKDDIPATIPTVGTNLVTVTSYKKMEVTVREMGGAMGPIWHNYYKDVHAVIFMIDISRQVQVAVACVQLMTMLSHPFTKSVCVLLLLNKIDIPNGMSRSELDSLMRLEEVIKYAAQKITVLETSAKSGHNLDKVAKWIYEQNKLDESNAT
uniref:ADP-ribosylation factor-like protein 16 n=1 Tax=Arion vulgaris TaxID=1028688 RepID=A0A0B6XZY6_9EUPU